MCDGERHCNNAIRRFPEISDEDVASIADPRHAEPLDAPVPQPDLCNPGKAGKIWNISSAAQTVTPRDLSHSKSLQF
jgi:hypothetical protein